MARGRKRLLVDGYNVLHAWQPTSVDSQPHAVTGRQAVIDAVRAIIDVDDVEVTVVFDGRESFNRAEAARSDHGVRVLFAPEGLTADGTIERLVAADSGSSPWIVATADRLERETVTAAGAECITPDELAQWVARCRERARRRPHGEAQFENKLPL